MWANTALGNGTRTFIFKLHNNTAGYNLAVSHFVRGHSPNCTFCDILGIQEINNETPLHLFFQCSVVENLTNQIFSWILEENVEISRQEFFTVFNRANFRKNSRSYNSLKANHKVLLGLQATFLFADTDGRQNRS
jgi:hypothetical protein